MAEAAQDEVKAADVPEQEVTNATEPDSGTEEAQADEVMKQDGANGEPAADDNDNNTTNGENDHGLPQPEAQDDAAKIEPEDDRLAQEVQDVRDAGDESPDRKRKEHPVSAHDRYAPKRSRGDNGDRHSSNKSKNRARFEDQPESDDADEIRRQVEFYFSDSNLPIDAYLLSETGGHRNKPVSLKMIHSFKRMRHFQPFSAVRDAVKTSSFLNLDDNDEITRKVPLSDKFTDNAQENRNLQHSTSMGRSIYAKGFGDENEKTHLDIEAFFAPYGPINAVRLRRHDDGEFKGSVFVEFADEETQRQFLELDPKPQFLEGEGKELEVMSKQEYVDMKHEGILEGTVKPRGVGERNHNRGRGRGRGRGGRGGGRGRGGRGGRGGRDYRDRDRDSRDHRDNRDRKRRRDDDDGEGERDDAPPTRAQAEAAKANGDAAAGAEDVKKEDAAAPSKKRARENGDDAGADTTETKKIKEDGVAV
ncbi:hypothetical protein BAUCODRAFT_108781 [Baudoinia panamericana UAMH 10762]|uniref:HTH La-type RNA-binding domain-containing protein n=1 Tax=Baudoinia panamericana (strain UAMH 10762) TaxID=717646 RepID=M2ND30_BAUPA|nr:uncharacterized protein BAUCODRAFT_108781 [Baudoinia panamericana UAMH 10762]EMC96830.1 hypothetical protein BAUCODRAFT_108781 [Baudoinia panamericana UAMH 10762]